MMGKHVTRFSMQFVFGVRVWLRKPSCLSSKGLEMGGLAALS